MSTTFSIIIPVYNVAPYLRECLDSVLAQIYTDWEAICVDDGSTDGSGAILDEYAAKDKRFRVMHQQNAGVSAARNAALDVATGEWVWFVDGDDVVCCRSLSAFDNVFLTYQNVDAIRFEFTKENDRIHRTILNEVAEISCRDVSKNVSVSDVDSFMCQVLYKRSVVERLRFIVGCVRGEDRVFVTAFMLGPCKRYVRLKQCLYFYRQRSSSAMHSRPSFEIVKSEIDFRIEQLRIVDASRKEKDVRITSEWIGWFFGGTHIFLISSCETNDRLRLYSLWHERAASLACRKDLSPQIVSKIKVDIQLNSLFMARFIYERNPMGTLINMLKRCDWLRRLVQSVRAGMRAFQEAWRRFVGKAGGAYALPMALRDKFVCDNRSRGEKRLLLVLAGYKRDLWRPVFSRVKAFAPEDLDVCVITSGKIVEELRDLCGKNGWTYLSTSRNNLCLAQNIAIDIHKEAEWIYKIDEDVFLTRGFFERLAAADASAPAKFNMDVGFVAPLLPVNGYGHVRLLKRLGLVDEWTKRFGALVHTEGIYRHPSILKDSDMARFLWGAWNDELRGIDQLNERMSRLDPTEALTVCPHRFSIGAILFSRGVWNELGMFPVTTVGSGLGADEEALCVHCMLHSRAIVVAENCVAGHLAFGPQTKAMLDFFHEHPELFELTEVARQG